MMKNVFLALSVMLFIGCKKEIDGTLNVDQELELNWRNTTKVVSAGYHSAMIRVSSKRKVKLFVDGAGKNDYYTFYFPEGTRLPERRGEIFVPSQQSRQPYDVLAKVDSEVRESNVRRDMESCSYREPRRVCYTDNRGRYRCRTEYRTVWGRREIEYVDVYTDRMYDVDFMNPGQRASIAHFKGQRSTVHRRHLYTGRCY